MKWVTLCVLGVSSLLSGAYYRWLPLIDHSYSSYQNASKTWYVIHQSDEGFDVREVQARDCNDVEDREGVLRYENPLVKMIAEQVKKDTKHFVLLEPDGYEKDFQKRYGVSHLALWFAKDLLDLRLEFVPEGSDRYIEGVQRTNVLLESRMHWSVLGKGMELFYTQLQHIKGALPQNGDDSSEIAKIRAYKRLINGYLKAYKTALLPSILQYMPPYNKTVPLFCRSVSAVEAAGRKRKRR